MLSLGMKKKFIFDGESETHIRFDWGTFKLTGDENKDENPQIKIKNKDGDTPNPQS